MKTLEKPRPGASDATSQTAWETPRTRALSLLSIALLCIPLFFFRLGAYALFDADEGRYAEIPRAMLASGDLVTPILNGVKFFDKPPLLYWLSALSFQIFGVNEFAARLPSATAATLAVFGAYFLGRRMFGARAGWLGAIILATTISWPILGRAVLTDMLVSSLVFLALAFWWIGRSQTEKRAQFWSFFGFWTFLALGVLAKGPVAVILAFGTIGAYLVFSGEWAVLRKMRWASGLAWLILLVAPWFIAVQNRNPEYFKAFWIDQNFGRFLGSLAEQDHANGPFYFFGWMPVLLFPWTLFAIPALFVGWKKLFPPRGEGRSQNSRAALFLLWGALVPPLFFSLSSSKLVTYIFPIVPMMAIALGAYLDWLLKGGKSLRAPRSAALCLALLCFGGGAAGLILAPPNLQKIGVAPNTALVVSAAMLLWGAALIGAAIRADLRAIIATTAVGFTLVFTGATGILTEVAPVLTAPGLVEIIRPGLDANGEIVSIGFTQSLSFYTGRRIAMVDSPDELRSGISHLAPDEKRRWFLESEADLKPYFGRATPVYIVLRGSRQKARAELEKINALGGDFAPVARNTRFTFVGNAAARRITPGMGKGNF